MPRSPFPDEMGSWVPREVTVCGAALQAASPGPFPAQSPAPCLRSSSLLKLALRGIHAGTRITFILAFFGVPDHPCRNQNNIHIQVLAIPGTIITSIFQCFQLPEHPGRNGGFSVYTLPVVGSLLKTMQATGYADGALALVRAAAKQKKKKKMPLVHVTHNTRPLRRNQHKAASSLAGTQQIDRIWMHAKVRSPEALNSKK